MQKVWQFLITRSPVSSHLAVSASIRLINFFLIDSLMLSWICFASEEFRAIATYGYCPQEIILIVFMQKYLQRNLPVSAIGLLIASVRIYGRCIIKQVFWTSSQQEFCDKCIDTHIISTLSFKRNPNKIVCLLLIYASRCQSYWWFYKY